MGGPLIPLTNAKPLGIKQQEAGDRRSTSLALWLLASEDATTRAYLVPLLLNTSASSLEMSLSPKGVKALGGGGCLVTAMKPETLLPA